MNLITSFVWIPIGTVLAGILLLWFATHIYQYRNKPGATWFILLIVLQSIWCFLYATALRISDPQLHYIVETLSWVALLWVGYLFLAFALEYTGRASAKDPKTLALTTIPVLASLAVVTSSANNILWTDATLTTVGALFVLDYSFTLWAYIAITSIIVYSAIGVLLLVETILSYGPLYRKEALSIAISTLPPAVGVLVWLFEVGPVPLINLAGVLSIPHVLFDAYAFVGTNMFESNPTTQRAAEETAIDDLPNPVIVIDTDQTIVRANTIAETRFGSSSKSLTGTHISAITGTNFSPTTTERTAEGHSEPLDSLDTITASTDIGTRTYTVLSSELTDPTQTNVGYTLVLQDVTHQQERSQRLDVFNRILRHNLRNKMSVVDGFATKIKTESPDESIQQWAQKINTNSAALQTIATKARTFDSIRQNGTDLEYIPLNTFITEIETTFSTNYKTATIETTIDDSITVYADAELLSLAVENIIENAIEHNPADAQHVTITATDHTTNGRPTTTLTIKDNGPGINDTDIEAIRSNTENSLIHGSSIGLWIVKWSINAIGGTLSFTVTDTGTDVTIELPTTETTQNH